MLLTVVLLLLLLLLLSVVIGSCEGSISGSIFAQSLTISRCIRGGMNDIAVAEEEQPTEVEEEVGDNGEVIIGELEGEEEEDDKEEEEEEKEGIGAARIDRRCTMREGTCVK